MRILVASFLFWGLLGSGVSIAQPFTPRLISGADESFRFTPEVWGDRIAWNEFDPSGRGSTYEYRFSTGEARSVLPVLIGADLRGDVFSFEQDGRPTTYNLQSGESTSLSNQQSRFLTTALGSKWAAWSASNDGYDIAARRVDAQGIPQGEVIQVTDGKGGQIHVDTDGDYLVWTDSNATPSEIKLRDMSTGTESTIGTGLYSSIDKGTVAWTNDEGLWVHEIASGESSRVSDISSDELAGIWGEQVVWMQDGFLHGYNVGSGATIAFELPSREGYGTPNSYSPSIYEDTVAWVQFQRPVGGGDNVFAVYAMQIPEPSSLALALTGIMLFGAACRRR